MWIGNGPAPLGAGPFAYAHPPMPSPDIPLRVALLVYRGNPHCGGQGVYVRYLSRALVELGHHVEVFSGQPYPELDPGVAFTPVPGLDLYRPEDPFRVPHLSEFRGPIDVLEFLHMCTAGFPEPLAFSLRIRRVLRSRRNDFDVVHDNQCLGYGLLGLMRDGIPLVATLHHPITVDRQMELAYCSDFRRRLALRRWYGFVSMQKRVARRLPGIVTVSQSSRRDIHEHMGVPLERMAVVPVAVDHDHFRPLPDRRRVSGRIMTTTSSDVPMKGLLVLLEALAKIRAERPDVHLLVVGLARNGTAEAIRRLGLDDAVRFVSRVDHGRLVELYAECQLAVVPSLYEGFSLPAIEAMACEVPVVATTGGALPEVVGSHGDTALLAPPGDAGALAAAIEQALGDTGLRERIGVAGRARVLERYTWRETARATVAEYRRAIAARRAGTC
jgi:MMP alpha-(1->4)-mannosyltransferase